MKKKFLIIITLVFFMLNYSASKAENISIPENFSNLPKSEKIIILKKLIIQIQIKINKILIEKNNINYTTYKDKRGGDFIIKYPANWEGKVYDSSNVFDYKIMPEKENESRLVVISTPKKSIIVNGNEKVSREKLKSMSENAIGYFYLSFKNVKILQNREIIVDGNYAREIELTYYDNMFLEDIYIKQVAILDSKNMILIDIKYPESDKNKYGKIFDNIVKNFKTTN